MVSKRKTGDRDIFLDLKVPVFINKNNGQWSLSIPKRKLKKMKIQEKEVPKIIGIRLFQWWK